MPKATSVKYLASASPVGSVALAIAAGCSMISCGALDRCGQSRNLRATIVQSSTATGELDGWLSLSESRDGKHRLSWALFFTGESGAKPQVTEVHLHPVGSDEVLYSFPVSVERADSQAPESSWILSPKNPSSSYNGSVPFSRLFGLVSSDQAYVDVHDLARGDAADAGVAVVAGSQTGWRKYCD